MAESGGLSAELRPVMTFRVAANWIGVRIDQMESVALAERLWPVPLVLREYVGLYDHGDQLIPVLRLNANESSSVLVEQMLAILHVRGEPVGLAIDRAGQVLERYWMDDAMVEAPAMFGGLDAKLARTSERSFWLINTDKLWLSQQDGHLNAEPSAETAIPL